MPPRLFQDLVVSGLARPGRGRARALPVSLLFHGLAVGALVVLPQLVTELPPVSAAPPTPIPEWRPVRMVEVAPRVPPPVRTAVRRQRTSPAQKSPPVALAGSGPTLPSDLSSLGTGDPLVEGPPLCLSNCTPGDGTGAVLPNPTGYAIVTGEDPAPRRAGLDVTPPAKLSGDPPVYPDVARRGRVQGDVVIECTIAPSGRVVNAVVTQSNPLFDEAALAAVRGWRYRPTLVDGVPVPVLMTVTVRFRIR